MAAIPMLKDFGIVTNPWWLWGWLGVFLFKAGVWDRYLNGMFADTSATRLAEINSSLAGSVDRIAQKLVHSADRRLGEEGSKSVCIALMHRMKDFVALALGGRNVRLRVDLAVPLPEGRDRPTSIRVWCYDETYDDSRWTELPLQWSGQELRGSPTAFVTGLPQIIRDIHQEKGLEGATTRRFRSVLSIPVKAGGPNGQTLAVLNIDADEPDVFTERLMEESIVPLVSTTVNVIALVLLNRREGSRYAFDS